MLETELKCILNKKTYDKIREMFVWDEIKEQTNSYYTDQKNELKRNGITLRIRTKDNKNKIQIKEHKNAGSPLQICEESEYPIDEIPESFSASEVKQLTGFEVRAMLLGSLTTLRHSLMYCDGVEICLDKSDYLDKTDYEIEVEYTKAIPEELMNKLLETGVEFKDVSVGKCTRFMQRLSDIMHGNF